MSTTTARILIVDDEESVRFVLQRALRHEPYLIETAVSGQQALEKLDTQSYDLLLLDLRMEPVDGLELLQRLREGGNEAVVIILTAHSSLESAVEALRLGAFDYLFKPASPNTIRQRVREALLVSQRQIRQQQALEQLQTLRETMRAWEMLDEPAVAAPPDETLSCANGRFIQAGSLFIDRDHRVATFEGELLDLTTAEFDLLTCLAERSPEPCKPQELVACALGYHSEETEARDTIKWHIHQLRRKIEPTPGQPRHIKTVRYRGYLWSRGS